MPNPRFSGVYVPLVTPFDADEAVDVDRVAVLVEWLLERGVHGLLALGTTGEAPHLSDDEAQAVVRAVVRAVRGRVPVLVGSGRSSVQETVRISRRFADLGADAVLVLTPSYYRSRMAPEVLVDFYAGVARQVPVPVLVYHMPPVSQIDLGADVLERILECPNVAGFKDSSIEGGPLQSTLHRCARPVSGFVGAGSRVLEALDAGAVGGVLAVAHVLPETAVSLYENWQRGEPDAARRMQHHAAQMAQALAGWAVAGVKHGLAYRGVDAGSPRRPLMPVPAEIASRIEACIDAALTELGLAPQS